MSEYKYQVLHFPALDGEPEYTNWWIFAFGLACRWASEGYEARILNQYTGKVTIL